MLHLLRNMPPRIDGRPRDVNAGLQRPGLLLAGIGAMGMGAALLMLADTGATRDLDVQVSPERVTVRRRFGW